MHKLKSWIKVFHNQGFLLTSVGPMLCLRSVQLPDESEVNMFIHSQVKCRNCNMLNDVFIQKNRHREIFCKCGHFMSIKEENGSLKVEYYYQGRIVREKVAYE